MSESKRSPEAGRGVALFLFVWGVGTACLSGLSVALGRFPSSMPTAAWLLLLIGTALSAAHAIRRGARRLAIGAYAVWATSLVGGFVAATYDPARPQDLLGYGVAVLFLVALGVHLERRLRG